MSMMIKAGYTANSSCGRVGRGGIARFHTFRLVLMDGRMDGPTDGRTDKGSYRVACPQLKMNLAWVRAVNQVLSK